jgi:hypothetical protein
MSESKWVTLENSRPVTGTEDCLEIIHKFWESEVRRVVAGETKPLPGVLFTQGGLVAERAAKALAGHLGLAAIECRAGDMNPAKWVELMRSVRQRQARDESTCVILFDLDRASEWFHASLIGYLEGDCDAVPCFATGNGMNFLPKDARGLFCGVAVPDVGGHVRFIVHGSLVVLLSFAKVM